MGCLKDLHLPWFYALLSPPSQSARTSVVCCPVEAGGRSSAAGVLENGAPGGGLRDAVVGDEGVASHQIRIPGSITTG